MKNNTKFLQSVSFLAFVFALIPLSPLPVFASAPTAGLDTPNGVTNLPIAVDGQAGLTLYADTSGATPPKPTIAFSGPINEGPVTDAHGVTTYKTTINTDGSMVIGTNTTTSSTAPVLSIAGDVGLGTTTPAAALDMYPTGDNLAFGGIIIHGDKPATLAGYPTAAGVLLDLSSDATDFGGGLGLATYSGAWATDAVRGDVVLRAGIGHDVRIASSEAVGNVPTSLIVKANGRVGMGTASPQANLQVDGAANAGMGVFLNANGSGNIPQYLEFGENGSVEWSLAGGGFTSPKDNNLYVMNFPDAAAGTDDGGYVMTFAAGTGNVGIGTTTPTAKLTLTNNTADTWFSIENQTPAGNVWGVISSGTGSLAVPGSFNIGQITGGYTHFTDALAIVPTGGSTYNVGINNSVPAYALDVNGTVNASGGAGALSDRRHKKDIQPLANNGLETVEKLEPVNFQWKEPKDDGMKGEQIGFIAQDVQKILPDTILTANDKDKTLSIKYNELIPVLTKAIQEQQAEIEALKQEVAKLKDK